jgi:hypothetical protein
MKSLLLVFMFFITNNDADTVSINGIRILFQKSATEKESCKKLITILQPYNETNNVAYAGYKACAKMMMAKYAINPINKLANFSQGKRLLEKCITIDKNNIELRFLRFAIQYNAPAILGYNRNIKEDKLILRNSIPIIKDEQLKLMISSYLSTINELTANEKK